MGTAIRPNLCAGDREPPTYALHPHRIHTHKGAIPCLQKPMKFWSS